MPVVYLIDERMSHPRAMLKSVPHHSIGFLVKADMTAQDIGLMVEDGLANLPPAVPKQRRPAEPGSPAAAMITALRILAHGDSYELHLGLGITAKNAIELAPLASQILGGAGSECTLLGCNIAMNVPRAERFLGGAAVAQRFGSPCEAWSYGDTRQRPWAGSRLLYAIARTLGVSVTAGLESERLAYDWHFMGSTIKVDPFGEITFAGMDTPLSYRFRTGILG